MARYRKLGLKEHVIADWDDGAEGVASDDAVTANSGRGPHGVPTDSTRVEIRPAAARARKDLWNKEMIKIGGEAT